MTGPDSKSWTLIHHRELGVIEVRYEGSITAADMLEGSIARMELGEREGVSNFLLDGSECTAEKGTAQVVYDIVTREYPTRGVETLKAASRSCLRRRPMRSGSWISSKRCAASEA